MYTDVLHVVWYTIIDASSRVLWLGYKVIDIDVICKDLNKELSIFPTQIYPMDFSFFLPGITYLMALSKIFPHLKLPNTWHIPSFYIKSPNTWHFPKYFSTQNYPTHGKFLFFSLFQITQQRPNFPFFPTGNYLTD